MTWPSKLTGGGPVPQLVMYRKTPNGWLRRKLIGGQSVEAVEEFINEAVARTRRGKAATKRSRQPVREAGQGRPSPTREEGQVAAGSPEKADSTRLPVSRQA